MNPSSTPPKEKKTFSLREKFGRCILRWTNKLVEKTDPTDQFMADASPEHAQQVNFYAHLVLWGGLLFFAIALIWAYLALLDEVAHGEGKVIPPSQIQIIQNLEGGIVQKIFVHEGELVEPGQILLKLDDTLFKSNYHEQKDKALALSAKIVRLTALVQKQPFSPPADLQAKAPDLVNYERLLYLSQQSEVKQAQKNYVGLQKEYNLTRPLVKGGAASEVEVLRLQRQLYELKERMANFHSKILEDLNEAKANLLMTNALMEQYQDRIKRTSVRSPVKGIVKQIKIRTIGGVAQPGMDLLEVVPLEESLLVEAKVSPKDIGFLHIGQSAVVKISAFDYSIYGGLPGKIEEISPDAILNKEPNSKGESYYLITVRTQKNHLISKQGKPLYIIPGMVATVDVLTGKKSVLTYLLNPLLKTKDYALKER